MNTPETEVFDLEPQQQPRPPTVAAERREVLRIREVAAILGCTERTVYKRLADGELASTKFGGMRLIPRRAIERLIGSEAA